MRLANPLWDAPRIHGELLKLGIAVAQPTVARYLPHPRKPPSQTWQTFLTSHLAQIVSIDFFYRADGDLPDPVRFRRAIASATPGGALRGDGTPHAGVDPAADAGSVSVGRGAADVLRDRDTIYGRDFAAMTRDMGMEEVLAAPRSPWQNPFVEWLVGSIRRECLDHVIVWNERSLRRTLHSYFSYYQRSRTHLAPWAKTAQSSGQWNRRNRGAW